MAEGAAGKEKEGDAVARRQGRGRTGWRRSGAGVGQLGASADPDGIGQGGGGSDCFFILQFRGVSVKTLPSQLLTIWSHLSESDQMSQIT